MAETISMDDQVHKRDVCNEIEKCRVARKDSYDFFSSTEQSKGMVGKFKTDFAAWRKGRMYSMHQKNDGGERQDLPEESKTLSLPRKLRIHDTKTSAATTATNSTAETGSTRPDASAEKPEVEEILCSGKLYKTSRGKISSDLRRGQHEHRQYRRFQLTEHSLEYSQLLQRVSIRSLT